MFQHETRVEGEIQLAGSNASAEEADEGCDSSAVSGVDIILNHRLVETGKSTDAEWYFICKAIFVLPTLTYIYPG